MDMYYYTDQVLHYHIFATAGSTALDQPSILGDLPSAGEKLGGGGRGGMVGLGKHPLEECTDDRQTSDKGTKQKKLSPRKCVKKASLKNSDLIPEAVFMI